MSFSITSNIRQLVRSIAIVDRKANCFTKNSPNSGNHENSFILKKKKKQYDVLLIMKYWKKKISACLIATRVSNRLTRDKQKEGEEKKGNAPESNKLNFRYACLIISHGCATVWIRLNYTAASNPGQTEYPLIELPGTSNSGSRKVRLPLKPRARFSPPEFEKHKRALSFFSFSISLFLSLSLLPSHKFRHSLVLLAD